LAGLADSKKLTERRREALYDQILERSTAWSLGRCEADEIDRLNIYQATMLAMKRAVDGLSIAPEYVLVDGNRCPGWDWPSEPVIKGDARVEAISAASILAKVTRDREMKVLHERFPEYGFAGHKGYPSPAHLAALNQYGAISEHRRSFRPVQEAIDSVGLNARMTAETTRFPIDLFENID
jgi:ribonuclease HII